jgi:hypothetical protein
MSRIRSFVDAVEAELDDETVAFVIGKVNEGKHGQRRRVHWYRMGGEIVPTERQGGTMTDGETTRTVSAWTRAERIVVHIFAENTDTVETLLDNLIVAIDHAAGVSAFTRAEYLWQENELAQRVPMVELEFRLALPVADEITTLVIIEAVETETAFVESLDE